MQTLRMRMGWEVVEGGVFLEELEDSGFGAEPSPHCDSAALPTWLRALYPPKEFHPRAPNPPASAGPCGGDPRPRLYLVQNKRKVFFPLPFFPVSLFWEQLCSPSREFPPPCSIPDDFPGARRSLREQIPAGKELHQPCLTLIHSCLLTQLCLISS